jgi:hypothetical protein
VNLNATNVFSVAVSPDMGPFLQHTDLFTGISQFSGQNRPVEATSNYQEIEHVLLERAANKFPKGAKYILYKTWSEIMKSFFEMSDLLENFETVQENWHAVSGLIDRIAGDADEALKPHIANIIQQGYKGGTHTIDELVKAAGSDKRNLYKAIMYLQKKGVMSFNDDKTFQIADINQFGQAGGSALKGARTGAISRKMIGHGDGQQLRGDFDSKLQQAAAKYPKHAETFKMIFASPVWKAMLGGKPARIEEIAPGVNMGALMGALDVLRHEEVVGFSGEPTPDTMVKARKFGDAVEGDLDRAAKQFPQYAQIFQKIMAGGAWKRLQNNPVQASRLLGVGKSVGKSGGEFNAGVEQALKALVALKHMGVIHFEGDKPTLATIIMKKAPEVEPENAFKGASSATDAQRAGADTDARATWATKMHGGTAQQKNAPGQMAGVAAMEDEPTKAISREWWQAWNTAMTAVERDPTLWKDKAWMQKIKLHTLTALQNIATQIQQAISSGADQSKVKPMLTNFFMIADPRNSEMKPMMLFHGVKDIATKIKAVYDGAYRRQPRGTGVR